MGQHTEIDDGKVAAPVVLMVDPRAPDVGAIRRAADVLRSGGLVAFPTETVYGLGANALDSAAVGRVFAAKERPADDPLIVHVLGIEAAAVLVMDVPVVARRLAEVFWPGPLTLVMLRSDVVPDGVTGGLDSVAVREPAHPVARALIAAAGVPVAAPSANPFGRTSPTTAAHVVEDLGGRVDVVLDGGACPVGVESTVLDCTVSPPRLLRPGGVTLEELRAVAGEVTVGEALVGGAEGSESIESKDGARRSPGTHHRHYAPQARLVLVMGDVGDVRSVLMAAATRLQASGRTVGVLLAEEDEAAARALADTVERRSIGSLDHLEGAASMLFAAVRELDASGADVILARDFGEAGLGRAIRDRLGRAAEGRVLVVEEGRVEEAVASVESLVLTSEQ